MRDPLETQPPADALTVAAPLSDAAPLGSGPRPGGSERGRPGGLARNVASNWAGHFVVMATGFVIPRIINDHLGQVQLGIWDLGWSLVHSLPLLLLGVGAAVNRYVARNRAAEDWEGLNRTASACLAVFLASALAALGITLVLAKCMPALLSDTLAHEVREARWAVLLLGATVALQMPTGVYNGVITGFQRYDVVNLIESACRIVGVAVMFVALLLGGGLTTLCAITLVREAIVGLLKWAAAHRLCPCLSISLRRLRWDAVRTVLVFGGKTYLMVVADIILYQGNRIILLWYLGPAALALFSRPMGLVKSMQGLVTHFGRVMQPVASEMQVLGSTADLARLLLKSNRAALLIALPIVLMLTVYGDPILRLWMGDAYATGTVLAVLALGHLASALQNGPYYILIGMGRHGVSAVALFAAAVVSVGLTALLLGVLHWGILGAALGLVLPLSLVNLVILPLYQSWLLRFSLRQYAASLIGGIRPVLPFAASLALSRLLVGGGSPSLMLTSLGVSSVVLLVSYWLMVPEVQRLARFGVLRRAA